MGKAQTQAFMLGGCRTSRKANLKDSRMSLENSTKEGDSPVSEIF